MKWSAHEPTYEMKEALRTRMMRIYHDFDHRKGAFRHLAYVSPRNLVTDEWAVRAGHPMAILHDAVTAWRTNAECKNGIDLTMLQAMNDLKDGVQLWKGEVGYRRKPVDLRELPKYRNTSEMLSYVTGHLSESHLDSISASKDSGTLDFSADFVDAIGHSVGVSIQIKLKYGGDIWATFAFPYYDHDREPTRLSMRMLSGLGVCVFLGIDMPDSMTYVADRSRDHFPNIDKFFRLFGAVCACLRD